MTYWTCKGNHKFMFAITKEFQWIGFLISTDNPKGIYDYLLIEIRFLFIRTYYIYEFKK